MIDRAARTALSGNLRHLAAGLITNDEYEDRLPVPSADLAVWEIHLNGAWYLYDDLHRHKLVGRYKIAPETKTEIARWILFLRTDLEYEWPRLRGLSWLALFLANLITAGLVGIVVRRRMRRAGDPAVWPFLRQSDYEAALAAPATQLPGSQ